MAHDKVRVRFAPSPTGGLHLGGVRTVLFNYLFAKQHKGDFVLRIEDTDQTRYVPGAEEYIIECLRWCGLNADEGPHVGGPFAPYRQSERKASYRQYAEQLVQQGDAYYAFETPEELDAMRERLKSAENPSPQYNHITRQHMRNSLTMPDADVQELLAKNTPHVIRIKMPSDETVSFTDMVRGEVQFNTGTVDDKVLLKADGMPTYHLAVVVDDYLMKISHAFRGEEWLPSAPVHIMLWKQLGWLEYMPQWAHLPLILKPDGNGKLSKRDGDRLGFPVYAMNWQDAKTGDLTQGFRERGYLPEAFVNMLAMLGWNDGSGQEIFSLEELVSKFSIERVHKSGAKFDIEKARWFNHQYIQQAADSRLAALFMPVLAEKGVTATPDYVTTVAGLVKDRCHYVNEIWDHGFFFFGKPESYDIAAVKPKWNDDKQQFFLDWAGQLEGQADFSFAGLEESFKALAAAKNIKMGELQLPFRIMLCGGKFGPAVFQIAATLGKEETISRIQQGLAAINA
ncbi:glutamate--tRNA ligase [Chitinophaga pendula]|uniref:glutamate--tRNA ligase n=1 Tax=Chitinophaga TaxID=79328 RepID=UPI000BAEE4AE|nr:MULTISPECIES: glutamate--tRNA ligase [Chitinophaga]ASZ09911.1 glutamate--tRNA ligase [Chitinophaga sp. MD30]UCJ07149.1 glutamate--tRNA ligase [Chitinophaga pendula]